MGYVAIESKVRIRLSEIPSETEAGSLSAVFVSEIMR